MKITLLLAVAFLLTACAPQTGSDVQLAVAQTLTAYPYTGIVDEPTATPFIAFTDTPLPSLTPSPQPSDTPTPTLSPTPANTPTITSTPLPPAAQTAQVVSEVRTATAFTRIWQATEIPQFQRIFWRELISYPQRYSGEKVFVRVIIREIFEETDSMRVEIGNSYNIFVEMREPFSNIYIGDWITVYGTWCGRYSAGYCMEDAFYRK